MAHVIEPETERALIAAIADSLADGRSLKIIGHGTKDGFGRPVVADGELSLAGLAGIGYYEPGELVLEAEAGTPLAEIEVLLAENGQRLAFEPPDLGPFYGGPAGEGTIGGVIACNLAGPRRPFAGAARDHILGIRAVSGRGEVFASGGRVVKNVTGYDMSKLLTGSFGTLAVLSRVTLKVMPRPEASRSILLFGLGPVEANAAMGEVAGGQWDISAAAHVPRSKAANSRVEYVAAASSTVTAFRLEGSRAGVSARCEALRRALGEKGETEELHGTNTAVFWAELGTGVLIGGAADGIVWRLSLPPAAGAEAAREIDEATGGSAVFDWAGGLVWLSPPGPASGPASGPESGPASGPASGEDMIAWGTALRRVAEAHGGHATLMRGPFEARHRMPVFHPEEGALAALSRRVKENFDPHGVLNPGRMVEGV